MEIYRKYGLEAEIRRELKGCEFKKLGEICKFDKKSKRKASYGKKDEGKYKFYSCSKKIKRCDTNDVKEQRIMIGTGGNPIIHIDSNFSCSTDLLLLNTKDNDIITNIFIYYYISTNIEDKIKMHGSTIKHFTKTDCNKLKIPIPKTLEHQQKLISIYKNKEKKLQDYENEIKHLENRIEDLNELGKQIIEANI
jgi:hypothetical protein